MVHKISLLAPLKLLASDLHPLLLPEPGVLLGNLIESAGLIGGVGGFEEALRVALEFEGRGGGGQ